MLLRTKTMQAPNEILDPITWLYYPSDVKEKKLKKPEGIYDFTIIDDGKRVGIVLMDKILWVTWVSWIPGFNYALRGTMKMLELRQIDIPHKMFVKTFIYKKKYSKFKNS